MDKTEFIALTDDEQQSAIARAIIAREGEIFAYELNIRNIETMLGMPDLTPETRKQLVDDLTAETRERNKARMIYDALKQQIPGAKLAAVVKAEKAKAVI